MTTPDVVVVDLRGKHYSYFNHVPDIAVGDLVMVELPQDGALRRFTGGFVTSVTPSDEQRAKATRWIVQKIDTTVYDACRALTPEPEKPKVKITPRPPASHKTTQTYWDDMTKDRWEKLVKATKQTKEGDDK